MMPKTLFQCCVVKKRLPFSFEIQATAEAGSRDGVPLTEQEELEEPVQLALVGRPNVGRSSTIVKHFLIFPQYPSMPMMLLTR